MRLRALLALLLVAALPAAASAAALAERLPAGASVLAEADFVALRASKLVDRAAWDAAGGPSLLERAGLSFRKDVDRVAVAVLPAAAEGKNDDFVALLAGRIDASKVKAGLLAQGGKPVRVGEIAAFRMAGGTSVALHPALPAFEAEGDVFVSFLGDLLVLASERGTRLAHGPKEGVPSRALAASRASVPSSSPAWLALDLGSGKPPAGAGPLAMAGGLKSIAAWVTLGDVLELKALAKAAGDNEATQLAGLASLLAGAAASSPDAQALSALKISAQGDAVTAVLRLSKAQLDALAAQANEPAVAPAPVAAPAPARSK